MEKITFTIYTKTLCGVDSVRSFRFIPCSDDLDELIIYFLNGLAE